VGSIPIHPRHFSGVLVEITAKIANPFLRRFRLIGYMRVALGWEERKTPIGL